MSKNLADRRDRHVLAQQVAASVVSEVMPRKVRKSRFFQQRGENILLQVIFIASLARAGAEHEASRVPVPVQHLELIMLRSEGCGPPQ